MTTPLTSEQPPIEDIRNALTIAQGCSETLPEGVETGALLSIVRLLRAALTKLAEPHPKTVAAARAFVDPKESEGAQLAIARDAAAVITHVALHWSVDTRRLKQTPERPALRLVDA